MYRGIEFKYALATLLCARVTAASAAELPLIDVHIHFSHDAW